MCRENATLDQQKRNAETEKSTLTQELTTAQSQRDVAAKGASDLEKLIIAKQVEINNLQAQHSASQAAIEALKKEIKLAEDQKTSAAADLTKLANDIKAKEESETALKAQIGTANSELETLHDQIARAELAKTAAAAEESKILTQLQTTEEQLSDISKLANVRTQIEESQTTLQRLQTELAEATENLTQKTTEYENYLSQTPELLGSSLEQVTLLFAEQKRVAEEKLETLSTQISLLYDQEGQNDNEIHTYQQQEVDLTGDTDGAHHSGE